MADEFRKIFMAKNVEIEFKNAWVYKSGLLVPWHPTLIDVVLWVERRFRVVVSETAREARHGGDVHATNPLRAVDLRSWIYNYPDFVAGCINRTWQYDHERPDLLVCLFHDTGNGPHFHIQVHDNTKKKG